MTRLTEEAYNRAYTYIGEMPPELRQLCIEVWQESQQLRACREFASLPALFCPDLGIEEQYALMLSEMYIYLTLSFRIQDCAVDERNPLYRQRLLCENIFLGRLLTLLNCFPLHIFQVVEEAFLEYSQASAFEIKRYSFDKASPVNPELLYFPDISFLGKKFSPLKIPLAAAVLRAEKGSLTDVNNLIDNYGISLQVRNDLLDWQEDWERGQLTYFLSKLVGKLGNEINSWPEIKDLKRLFVYSEVVEEMLQTERHYIKKTVEISRRISINLSNFFKQKIEDIDREIQDLKSWRNLHTKKRFYGIEIL